MHKSWSCVTRRALHAVAEGRLSAFCLAGSAVNELLGPIQALWRFEALRRVPILFNLSEAQLLQLAKCMAPRSFATGDVVFRKGDAGAPHSARPVDLSGTLRQLLHLSPAVPRA